MVSLELPGIFVTLQIPLLYLNNIVALAIPPEYQILRVGISLPVVVLLAAQSLFREWEGSWANLYAIECTVLSAVAVYVDWILLSMPDKEKWRKIQYSRGNRKEKTNGALKGTANGAANGAVKGAANGAANGIANGAANGIIRKRQEETEEYPTTFWKRLWWAARLATTNRYVGWTSQAKNVAMEVDSDYPRILFIVRKSLRVLLFYVAKDAVLSYSASTPLGSWMDIVRTKPLQDFTTAPFWTRFQYAWVHILISYYNLEFVNGVYGVVSVATGLANPRDCPSIFGDLKELVTVRKLWSTVWHQQCRRIASDPGVYIGRDVLGLKKGSFASKYVQLFIGFGVSAIVHAGASMFIHRSLEDDGALSFFMGQAMIIMIEDHVIDLGKSLGFKRTLFWRVIGFAWVVLIMGMTLQVWCSKMINHGMWVHDREHDFLGIGPLI